MTVEKKYFGNCLKTFITANFSWFLTFPNSTSWLFSSRTADRLNLYSTKFFKNKFPEKSNSDTESLGQVFRMFFWGQTYGPPIFLDKKQFRRPLRLRAFSGDKKFEDYRFTCHVCNKCVHDHWSITLRCCDLSSLGVNIINNNNDMFS